MSMSSIRPLVSVGPGLHIATDDAIDIGDPCRPIPIRDAAGKVIGHHRWHPILRCRLRLPGQRPSVAVRIAVDCAIGARHRISRLVTVANRYMSVVDRTAPADRSGDDIGYAISQTLDAISTFDFPADVAEALREHVLRLAAASPAASWARTLLDQEAA